MRESKEQTLNSYPERQMIWIDAQLKKGNSIFSSPEEGEARWNALQLYPNNDPKPFHHHNPVEVFSFVQSTLSDKARTRLVNNIRIWRSRTKSGYSMLQINVTDKTKEDLYKLCKNKGLIQVQIIEN